MISVQELDGQCADELGRGWWRWVLIANLQLIISQGLIKLQSVVGFA